MARVSIRRAAAAEGNLPARCLCCGKPTDGFVMTKFSWPPVWALLTGFRGGGPLMWEDLRVTTRIRAPLCPRHQHHWSWRAWLYWGGLTANLVFAAVVLYREGRVEDGVWKSHVALPLLVPLVVWTLAAGAARLTSIRPVEITREHLVLTGVSSVFVAALEKGEHPTNPGVLPSGPRSQ
jgi:hypothetical protein